VNKRKSERNRFLEFHYALGGLLIYKKRYACLERIFSYTDSHPPKYELLPESMVEIFDFYNQVHDPYDIKYPWISKKYTFPEQNGLKSNSVIKKWIASYMAILFLRQYTIISYLSYMKPLDYPQIPQTQSEIKQWIDSIDFFKKLVSEHLKNEELLRTLRLDVITKKWCQENEKKYPLDFLDEFTNKLQERYEINALDLPIDKDKVNQFNILTKESIESTLAEYKKINNIEELGENVDKWYFNGEHMLQGKEAFTNPEVLYIDFDSKLASVLSRKIKEGIASTFLYKRKKSYLLKPNDIFKGIDKLKIDKDYIIIGFGFWTDYYVGELKVNGLSKNKYKGVSIYNFQSSMVVNNSLFILKKLDLPIISTKPIAEDTREKYSLEKISKYYELYSSVIDLNNATEEIFNESKHGKKEDEVRKSVLLSIIVLIEIVWKKNIQIVQIIEHSEYRQMGLPNNLNEIGQINPTEKSWCKWKFCINFRRKIQKYIG